MNDVASILGLVRDGAKARFEKMLEEFISEAEARLKKETEAFIMSAKNEVRAEANRLTVTALQQFASSGIVIRVEFLPERKRE